MSNLVRNIIGNNVKSLRIALGLSLLNFSIVTELSKASVINIESGKTGYNLNLLDNIILFSRQSLSDLSNENYVPTDDLRDKLINHYKNNPEFISILSQTPEIVYAVKYKLLKSDFINSPKEINEIKIFFEQFGWKYLGTSISNTLKRLPAKILISKHPSKKNTHVYSKI
ncbi:helix-turn-helix domain-containing protein [Pedobacter cryoconitis]|uniref:helix-turn-helix domain-containing protein n=1 Tax=Pedobacter cryoconitis TaxID=188932 RepID=UPI001611571E|nr:helix-turn-helix transcriptional regulator [Pedobacter cryoconitis]MBB5647662.1 transcriptional regulator with XRE-family HTH domain [Pedobacter cryoconitis]